VRAEEELRFLMLGVQREGNRALAAALAPLGLTPAQAEVVRCLGDRAPLSLRELGGLLVCEGGSPSRLVDTLVGRGIVERREDPVDRRRVVLLLTPEGRRLDAGVRQVEEALYARIDAALGRGGIAAGISLLRPLVEGSIAGAAIARRRSGSR
jgi:DNA-binding MarR family transcriptional regulator